MIYRKNLPTWERVARLALGLALVGYGIMAGAGPLVVGGALLTAVTVIVTGIFGYCPVCSLAGRKPLERPEQRR